MACSAERRSVASSASCRSCANRRCCASMAASISVLRGRIDASTTPRRSAALRLACRKSSTPCSRMMRAASSATACRSSSARGLGRRLIVGILVQQRRDPSNLQASLRAAQTCVSEQTFVLDLGFHTFAVDAAESLPSAPGAGACCSRNASNSAPGSPARAGAPVSRETHMRTTPGGSGCRCSGTVAQCLAA